MWNKIVVWWNFIFSWKHHGVSHFLFLPFLDGTFLRVKFLSFLKIQTQQNVVIVLYATPSLKYRTCFKFARIHSSLSFFSLNTLPVGSPQLFLMDHPKALHIFFAPFPSFYYWIFLFVRNIGSSFSIFLLNHLVSLLKL